MSAREQVAFLVGSEHRIAILEALRPGPSRPCELERTLSASRATVQRALSGLDDRGWVRKRDGRYHLTGSGTFVLRGYRELTAVVETVDEVGAPLSLLDTVTADMPVDALRTATATTATPTTPHAPIERYASVLDAADVDRFRGICPVLSPVFNEVHRPLVEADVVIDLIIDERTLAAAEELTPENHAAALENDSFRLGVVEEDLDFGASLFGAGAAVGAYDDEGRFRACLDATDSPFVEWVDDLYATYWDRACLLETA